MGLHGLSKALYLMINIYIAILSTLYFSACGSLGSRIKNNQNNHSSPVSSTTLSTTQVTKSSLSEPSPKGRSNLRNHPFIKKHQVPTRSLIKETNPATTLEKKLTKRHLSVGVLLPLSGPNQRWGRYIERAIKNASNRHQLLNILFADSAGEPWVAIKALDHWMNEDKIDALIGPLSPYVATPLAQRVSWYELPWFPLGSLSELIKNSFSISWRMEASDESQMVSKAICQAHISNVALVIKDQPRAHLNARLIRRSLKRCQTKVSPLIILKVNQKGQVTDTEIDRGLVRLSGRDHRTIPDPWWRKINSKRTHPAQWVAPQVKYQAVILLLRGRILTKILSQFPLWDIEIKPNDPSHLDSIYAKYRGYEPPWVRIFTGLGATSVATGVVASDQLNDAVMIDRPPLSQEGEQYVRAHPRATALELEVIDLFKWLGQTHQYATHHQLRFIEALRETQTIQGIWGVRRYQSGKLNLPKFRYYTSKNGHLKRLSIDP